MSRWQTEFEQHPFQSIWKLIIEESETLAVDDETVLTSVQEMARLKKVIEYLKQAMANIDVELAPQNVWDNFHNQCGPCLQEVRNYNSSRNIGHIKNANMHLDNLLSYVRPYLILPESIIKVLTASSTAYQKQLEDHVNAFRESAVEAAIEIKKNRTIASNLVEGAKDGEAKIKELVTHLIIGDESRESIKKTVESEAIEASRKFDEISTTHKLLLIGSKEEPSIKAKIEKAASDIIQINDDIAGLLRAGQSDIEELRTFNEKIFGARESDSAKRTGGLKDELDARIAQLDALELDQLKRYAALYEKIEKLLPGATSAGLARAYEVQRRSFSDPIRKSTNLFYTAVILMPIVTIVGSIENASLSPFTISFFRPETLDEIFRSMLLKAPFIAPLVWLAIFASIRRSQYERLQQEYAHKEALAKSYESYKKQLEALMQANTEDLQKELISKAVDAIAYNASQTLDGRHRDKMPIEHAIELLSNEKTQTFLERLKSILSIKQRD